MTQARFFYQLAALLQAGLAPAQGLTMAAQGETAAFRAAIKRVVQEIDAGRSLTVALQRATPPLSRWEVSLLNLGEVSGMLAPTCQRLGELVDMQRRRSRLYGSILLSGGVMLTLLLAAIAALIRGSGGITQPVLIGVGLGLILLLIAADQWQLGTDMGDLGHRLGRHLPIANRIVEARSLTILAELALPLRCGLSVAAGLELVYPRIPDPVLAKTLKLAAYQAQRGRSLTESLRGKLPPTALQLLRTGEETGTLDTMLDKIGDYYEQDLERRLRQLSGILRPLSIVAAGGMVLAAGAGMLSSLLAKLPT